MLLTCEEPCAALLPHVSGYIDCQFNANCDLIYAHWTKSRSIQPVPLFSTMFGDVVTPFTDVDDVELARTPPGAWLHAHKVKARPGRTIDLAPHAHCGGSSLSVNRVLVKSRPHAQECEQTDREGQSERE